MKRTLTQLREIQITAGLILLTLLCLCPIFIQAQVCNVPLVGKGRVIDQLSGGTACLLCSNGDLEHLVDGDLSNYAEFTLPVVLLSATPVVSVKDIENTFAAGTRAGFVVEIPAGLLNLTLLSGFQIRTYLDNSLQEIVSVGDGLSVSLLASSGGKQRISFVTSEDYDEIELVMVSTIGLSGAMRIYYAYEEPANGCDYTCRTPLVSGLPGFSPTINAAATGIFGVCIGCGVFNEDRVVDTSLSNFGRIFMLAGFGATGRIAVDLGATVPAGSSAGFLVRNNGVNGLLDLTLLGGTFVDLYRSGVLKQSFLASDGLVGVDILNNDIQAITVDADSSFDQIRLRVSGLNIAVDLRVYYAFYAPDADNDGFPDCVDKCAGEDDNFDFDGDGIPDACDTLDCTLTAGLDLAACPPNETAQLPAALTGQNWTAVAGNPSAATVNSVGEVSGMTVEGAYYFALNDTTLGCSDTVAILLQTSALGDSCNNPIFGHGVAVFDPSAGNCTLCLEADLFLDAVITTSVSLDASISLSPGTPIIGVVDTLHDYPAGRRVGMVVEAVGGLIDLTLLGNFELRTYLDNNLQETATVGNTLLDAGVLAGSGNRHRLSFVTTQPFDAVVLVSNALLSTIDSLRIYYAFEEPVNGCPDLTNDVCTTPWLVSNEFCAGIAEERTGITGVACVGCSINAIGNLIDSDSGNAATITLTVGVGAAASVAVTTIQTLDETYEAGFVLSGGINLLDVGILAGLQLRTYMDGVPVDNYFADNSLVNITLLGNGSDLGLVSLKPTGEFNEIRLTIYGLVNALQTTQVYYAFVRKDSDLDNTPDCIDKCCLGSDDVDTDGDGIPDPCDPIADIQVQLSVSNLTPSYGSTVTITMVVKNEGPSDVTNMSVENIVPTGFSNIQNITNGGVLTDSIIQWTGISLAANDSLVITFEATVVRYGNYQNKAEIKALNEEDIDADPSASFDFDDLSDNISDDDEDILELTPVNDAPLAANDLIATEEDSPVIVPVLVNDSDPNSDTLVISGVSDPPNGTVVIVGDSIQYIPDPGFFGQDTFQYFVCDVDNVCDTGIVAVTVSAIDVRLNVKVFLQGGLYNSPDTTLMRDDLRAAGYLPLLEPYLALPEFLHLNGGGGELVSDSAQIFGDHGANSIIDWVFIELRDSANPAIVVSTRAGLLQRDGDVVDVDGVSALEFDGSVAAFFYVAVRHRNHLGCMSANPLSLSATGTTVDFSDVALDLWDDGTNMDGYEQTFVWGKRALWAGNVDPNNKVTFAGQSNDKDPLFNAVDQAPGNIFRSQSYQFNGYHLGDVNLSGKAIFSGQTNDVDYIFNNVDGHPRNIFRSQSFSIREQLAR